MLCHAVPCPPPLQVYSEEPVVIDSLRNFTALSVGGSGFFFHACGLEAGGQALCWGEPGGLTGLVTSPTVLGGRMVR